MLNRLLLVVGTVGFSFSLALGAHAQSRAGAEANAGQTADKKIHLEGCVFPQKALTAGDSAAAPSGTAETYVLTDLKIIAMSPGVNDSTDRIFVLEQADQDELRSLVGRRADVVARVSGTDQSPQLQVISIIHTVGQCPEKPTPVS